MGFTTLVSSFTNPLLTQHKTHKWRQAALFPERRLDIWKYFSYYVTFQRKLHREKVNIMTQDQTLSSLLDLNNPLTGFSFLSLWFISGVLLEGCLVFYRDSFFSNKGLSLSLSPVLFILYSHSFIHPSFLSCSWGGRRSQQTWWNSHFQLTAWTWGWNNKTQSQNIDNQTYTATWKHRHTTI